MHVVSWRRNNYIYLKNKQIQEVPIIFSWKWYGLSLLIYSNSRPFNLWYFDFKMSMNNPVLKPSYEAQIPRYTYIHANLNSIFIKILSSYIYIKFVGLFLCEHYSWITVLGFSLKCVFTFEIKLIMIIIVGIYIPPILL